MRELAGGDILLVGTEEQDTRRGSQVWQLGIGALVLGGTEQKGTFHLSNEPGWIL